LREGTNPPQNLRKVFKEDKTLSIMNKKWVMPIALLTILSLAIFVSAEEFTINKGWNLIGWGMVEDLGEDNVLGRTYFFNPLSKDYFLYSEETKDEFEVGMSSAQERYEDPSIYFLSTPVWYYSSKDVKIDTDKLGDLKNIQNHNKFNLMGQLFSGWNLITLNGAMLDKSFYEFKGNCEILGIYYWRSNSQEWHKLSSKGDMTGQTVVFNKENGWYDSIGEGLAVKVNGNCNLAFAGSISNPPAIPDNEECTDSDGGLNYYVKGSVAGQNEDAPNDEITSATDTCNGNTLYEFICKTSLEYDDESYICPNGCSEGACIQ
jgi:hypothetical protein